MDANDNKNLIPDPEELTITDLDDVAGGGNDAFSGGGSFGPFARKFPVGAPVILKSRPDALHAEIHSEPVIPGGPYQVYLYFGKKGGEEQIDIVEAYPNEIILKQ